MIFKKINFLKFLLNWNDKIKVNFEKVKINLFRFSNKNSFQLENLIFLNFQPKIKDETEKILNLNLSFLQN